MPYKNHVTLNFGIRIQMLLFLSLFNILLSLSLSSIYCTHRYTLHFLPEKHEVRKIVPRL